MPKRDVVLSLERRPATASSGSSGVLPLHNHDESYYTESEINARLADLLDKTTYDPDGDGNGSRGKPYPYGDAHGYPDGRARCREDTLLDWAVEPAGRQPAARRGGQRLAR